mgnify:CR=1 FL=1
MSIDSLRSITAEDLKPLNEWLENQSPEEILRWADERFGQRLCLLSSFQQAGCAMCHMVASLGLQNDIDVIFVDTGVNFPETIETVERISREYELNVVTLHPKRTMEEQTREEGVLYLSSEGQKRCCGLRKKEPLKQIRGRYDAMLSSLRRGSGGKRASIPPLAIDSELNLFRIHPFLNMTDEELDEYIEKHEVIINPLHAQGFPTISCNRCTTPVLEGEPERAGRWRHLQNEAVYCNINPTDRSGSQERESVDLPADVAKKYLHFEI